MEKQKNLETANGSSPNYDLSNHTTYGHTQTGAAVPLICVITFFVNKYICLPGISEALVVMHQSFVSWMSLDLFCLKSGSTVLRSNLAAFQWNRHFDHHVYEQICQCIVKY